jgi:hypothetical protein
MYQMTKGIITLCGSTKFKEQFNDANFWLTMNGYIVLSVGSFLHSDSDPAIKDIILANKHKLDALHKEKIDMAKAIMVIDVGGYAGESTKSEIAHAFKRGIPIYSYELSKDMSSKLTDFVLAEREKIKEWLKEYKNQIYTKKLETTRANRGY